MFQEYLKRSDVDKFILNIQSNEKYFQKELGHFEKYPFYISKELALYIFYDALFLYKVIIDDTYLFDGYLEQVETLYRKIDQFDQLIEGIHKLIGKMVSLYLNISDIDSYESREKILSHIYNRYIQNGYFLHGFNGSYSLSILENGFNPENYENCYSDFVKVRDIFSKYNVSCIIEKDFSDKRVTFTDDFVMSCIYSSYSPMFYSSFLENSEYFGNRNRKDGYIIDDYSLSIYGLKKYMSDNLFQEDDRKFVLKTVKKEWDLLHRVDKNISILLVKRKVISHKELFLTDFLNDDSPIYDVVDRLLNSKYSVVYDKKRILLEDIDIISLDSYYKKNESNDISFSPEDEYYEYKEKEVNQEFLDVYGKISLFLVLGSLLIIFGVLFTIFMILRGM